MDSKLLEQLLNEDESTTLDFKQSQYPFEKTSEEQKSELLKDILAFANSWRRTDAFILIGVKEIQGGRSTIIGVANHLSEANLQQFVNQKTNRPITFSYEVAPIEDTQIGIIRVPIQERPIYLLKDYGKLKAREVYIRRGSSTDIATPDEIARIGAYSGITKDVPLLSLEVADVEKREKLGQSTAFESLIHTMPELSELPDFRSAQKVADLNLLITSEINRSFYREYALYLFQTSALMPVGFVVQNLSSFLIHNARVEIQYPVREGVLFLEEADYPERPQRYYDRLSRAFDIPISPILRSTAGDVEVFKRNDYWEISVLLGSIQPKASIWSDTLYIACLDSENPIVEIEASIFMDQGDPLQVPLVISFLHDYEPVDNSTLLNLITQDEATGEK